MWQDPGDGYYRIRFNLTTDISDPITVIGDVRPCECYGHANACHRETGKCLVSFDKTVNG